MSSIIPFRLGQTTDRHEGDQSEFLATGMESVNTAVLAYETILPTVRDWTNQEMADLARVQYLLSRAGVPLEVERGLTDEGDPWFVFCDMNGEVFVHICRIGMVYLLDGPSLEEPLRGTSFDSLVKSFIDRATAKVAALNVVPISKGNKVFLHPSVMLTALIWSIFLLNDQMTNAAYASTFEEGMDTATSNAPAYDVETAFALLAAELQENGDGSEIKAFVKLELIDREIVNSDKVILSQAILSPAVITSLSTIVLAFGLLQPAESLAATLPQVTIETSAAPSELVHSLTVEVTERHAAPKADEEAHSLDQQQPSQHDAGVWTNGAGHAQLLGLTGELRLVSLDRLGQLVTNYNFGSELPTTSADSFGRDIVLNGPIVARISALPLRNENGAETHDTKAVTQKAETATIAPKAETALHDTAAFSAVSQIATFAQLADQIVKHSEGLIIVHSTDVQSVATPKALGNIHDLLLTSYTESTSDAVKALLKFNISDTFSGKTYSSSEPSKGHMVMDSMTRAEDKTVDAAPTIPSEIDAPHVRPLFSSYNEMARGLVDYLLSKEKDIVVVTLTHEIIILDKSALDEATDVAYAQSWSVDGGGIVSTIGHFDDYKHFGLLS